MTVDDKEKQPANKATETEQAEIEEEKARRSLLWRHLLTLGMDIVLEMAIVFLKNYLAEQRQKRNKQAIASRGKRQERSRKR